MILDHEHAQWRLGGFIGLRVQRACCASGYSSRTCSTSGSTLSDIDREIARARRTTGLLAVAYVDVIGLKAANDRLGHAAGDALLQRVVHTIRGQLRSYDSIVRLGGDEFLCVMSGATVEDARERFATVHAALALDPDPCQVRVGFTALGAEDRAADLIERADADMPTGQAR